MKRFRIVMLAGALVLLLAPAGTAVSGPLAVSGGVATDPAGDSGAGADIVAVRVASKLGTLTFDVTIAGRPNGALEGEAIRIGLDVDNDATTGNSRGLDVLFERLTRGGEGRAAAYSWNNATKTWDADPSLGAAFRINWNVTASPSPNAYRFIIRRSLVRIGSAFSFAALSEKESSPDIDFAPDSSAYVVRDTSAPVVKALRSIGKRGAVAKLKYKVSDDTGKSVEAIAVFRGTKVIARLPGELGEALGRVYHFKWRVPRKLKKGKYRFCVIAGDEAENVSRRSCAKLTIK